MTVTLQDYSFKDIALKTHKRTYKIRELVKALVLNVFLCFQMKTLWRAKALHPFKVQHDTGIVIFRSCFTNGKELRWQLSEINRMGAGLPVLS